MNVDSYLLCIIATTFLASILTSILPEGRTSGIIKGITKLVCLLSILSPIPNFLQKQSFFDFFNDEKTQISQEDFSQSVIRTDSQFIKYVSDMRIRFLTDIIVTAIEREYGVNVEILLTCESDLTFGELVVVSATLKNAERFSETEIEKIKDYLKKYNCNEVKLEE